MLQNSPQLVKLGKKSYEKTALTFLRYFEKVSEEPKIVLEKQYEFQHTVQCRETVPEKCSSSELSVYPWVQGTLECRTFDFISDKELGLNSLTILDVHAKHFSFHWQKETCWLTHKILVSTHFYAEIIFTPLIVYVVAYFRSNYTGCRVRHLALY